MESDTLTKQQIEFEHEATRRAGSCHVLQKLPERYPQFRFPTFFAADKKRDHDYPQKIENALRASSYLSKPLFEFCPERFAQGPPVLLLKGGAEAHRKTLEDTFGDPEKIQGGIFHHVTNQVVELAPLATTREKIEIIAGFPQVRLNVDPSATAAQADAFIIRHELQHGRSREVWPNHQSEMLGTGAKEMPVPELALKSAGYRKLFDKTSQINPPKDKYLHYLNENMSDTVAALHHLKEGGSADFIEQFSQARRKAFNRRGEAHIYASHYVLDYIVKHHKGMTKNLEGLADEKIEEIAAGLVGGLSMEREEFYKRGIAIQALELARAYGDNPTEIDWQTEAAKVGSIGGQLGETWRQYLGLRAIPGLEEKEARRIPTGHDGQTLDEFVTSTITRYSGNIKKQLFKSHIKLNSGDVLTPHEHALDIYAAIKHQQNRHPEYGGVEGAEYLLKKRMHFTAMHYQRLQKEVPDLDKAAHGILQCHLNKTRRLEQNTRPENEKSETPSRA